MTTTTVQPREGASGRRVLAILGLPFNDVSFDDVLEWISRRVQERRPAYIATANLDFVMQAWNDPEQQRILLEADLVVADGFPIVWLSRWMGMGLTERVTGSDLTPMLAGLSAREGYRLFLLGGAPGVPEKAAAKLAERAPGVRIAGCFSPPKADLLDMDHAAILSRLADAKPDILLVAFGAPKQEKWVHMHIHQWDVPVAMGIGGSLDFLAGAQKRAPRLFQKMALEWLWRMLSDPRRLVGRYARNFVFLARTLIRLARARYGYVPARSADAPMLQREELADWGAQRVPMPAIQDAEVCARFLRDADPEDGTRAVVVDLEARPWLNPMETGALIQAARLARAGGRLLYVLAAHPRSFRQLQLFHLENHLNVFSAKDALLNKLRMDHRSAREGVVESDAERKLTLVLPMELTAARLPVFRKRVEEAWRSLEERGGLTGLRVDASTLSFIDSAALGFLVLLKRRIEAEGGAFSGFGYSATIRQTLKIARLDKELMA